MCLQIKHVQIKRTHLYQELPSQFCAFRSLKAPWFLKVSWHQKSSCSCTECKAALRHTTYALPVLKQTQTGLIMLDLFSLMRSDVVCYSPLWGHWPPVPLVRPFSNTISPQWPLRLWTTWFKILALRAPKVAARCASCIMFLIISSFWLGYFPNIFHVVVAVLGPWDMVHGMVGHILRISDACRFPLPLVAALKFPRFLQPYGHPDQKTASSLLREIPKTL